MKNSKGITLVAMVITIIVMLILAGVSISMVVGENGVLTRASTSSTKTNLSSVAEDFNLAVSDLEMQYQNLWADASSIAAYKPIFVTYENLNATLSQSKVLIGANYVDAKFAKKQKTNYVTNEPAVKEIKDAIYTDNHPIAQLADTNATSSLATLKGLTKTNYFALYLSNGKTADEPGSDVYCVVAYIDAGMPHLVDIGLVQNDVNKTDCVNGALKYNATSKKIESDKGKLPTMVTWLYNAEGLENLQ